MPSSSSSPPPESPPAEPLGLKNPLLPIRSLGQNWLSPKFLTPLGANSLTVLDPDLFSPQAASDAGSPSPEFADSPFFTKGRSRQFDSRVALVAPPEIAAVRRSPLTLPAVQPRLDPFPEHAAADDLDGVLSVESHPETGSYPSEVSDGTIAVESASMPTISPPETVQSPSSRIQRLPEAWEEPVPLQQPKISPHPALPAASRPTPDAAALLPPTIPPTIPARREAAAAAPESPAPALESPAPEALPDLPESLPEASGSASSQSLTPPTLQARSQPGINLVQPALPKQDASPISPTPRPIADATTAPPSPASVLPDRQDTDAAQAHDPATTFSAADELNPTRDRPEFLDRGVPTVQARFKSPPLPPQAVVSPGEELNPAEHSQFDQLVSTSQPTAAVPTPPTLEAVQGVSHPNSASERATAADTPFPTTASSSPPAIQTRLESTLPERSDAGAGNGPVAPPSASPMPEFASSPLVSQTALEFSNAESEVGSAAQPAIVSPQQREFQPNTAASPPTVQPQLEPTAEQPAIAAPQQPDSQPNPFLNLPTVQPQLEPTAFQADATEPEAAPTQASNPTPAARAQPTVPLIQRQQGAAESSTMASSTTEPGIVSMDDQDDHMDHLRDTAAEPSIVESPQSTLHALEQVNFAYPTQRPNEPSRRSPELESVGNQSVRNQSVDSQSNSNQHQTVSPPVAAELPQPTATSVPTVQARLHSQPELSEEFTFAPQTGISSAPSISASPTSISPTPSTTQSPTTPHDSVSAFLASEVASTIQSQSPPQISLRQVDDSIASNPALSDPPASEVASTIQSQSPPQISLRQVDRAPTSEPPHSPSSPSTEFTTNSNLTEPASGSEPSTIPQLPTVLTNLSTLNPLGSVKPLARSTDFLTVPDSAQQNSETPSPSDTAATAPVVQAKLDARSAAAVNPNSLSQNPPDISGPPIDLDDSPTTSSSSSTVNSSVTRSSPTPAVPSHSSVPEAWSSIDELLSQSTAPRSAPIVQRFVDDASLEQLFNQSGSLDLAPPPLNPDPATPLPAASSVTGANTAVGEAPGTSGSDRASTPAEQSSSEHSADSNESDALESLAREIYGLLRQRLEIERERQGNDYSGRLPW